MKKLILTLIFVLFCGNAFATATNYTTFIDGQIVNASDLNGLQTWYTDAINAVLDGDIFTGDMTWYSGSDIDMFSDTGTNRTIKLFGDSGKIYGCPQEVGVYGLSFLYSGGRFTLECNNTTCSALNPGCVVTQSQTTPGDIATILITNSFTFDDDAATSSDLTNQGWGITETAHYLSDKPFYIYLANPNDSAADGTDGNPTPFIAAVPNLKVTTSNTVEIGDTGAISSTDNQNSEIYLDDITVTNYDAVPAILVGAIRMRYSTTSDDWTVQTLSVSDGVGNYHDTTDFDMPTGQMGAFTVSSHLAIAAGGTSIPTWAVSSSVVYKWNLKTTGEACIKYETGAAGNVSQGLSSQQLSLTLPFTPRTNMLVRPIGYASGQGISTAQNGILMGNLLNTSSKALLYDYGIISINSNDFGDVGGDLGAQFCYDIL